MGPSFCLGGGRGSRAPGGPHLCPGTTQVSILESHPRPCGLGGEVTMARRRCSPQGLLADAAQTLKFACPGPEGRR